MEQSKIHRSTPVVARPFRRIGDEHLLMVRRRIPEHFRHIPGPVSVVKNQAIAILAQLGVNPRHRLRRRTLQKRPRLVVQLNPHEVVRGRVTNIQPDRRVQLRHFHEVRPPELAGLDRRNRRQSPSPQLLGRQQRLDPEHPAFFDIKEMPPIGPIADPQLPTPSRRIAFETHGGDFAPQRRNRQQPVSIRRLPGPQRIGGIAGEPCLAAFIGVKHQFELSVPFPDQQPLRTVVIHSDQSAQRRLRRQRRIRADDAEQQQQRQRPSQTNLPPIHRSFHNCSSPVRRKILCRSSASSDVIMNIYSSLPAAIPLNCAASFPIPQLVI